MDVQCERCKDEYELDDALVSERGTTVRCTACGYRFRVHRSDGGADRWFVVTGDGQKVEFQSLDGLRDAIVAGRFRRDDTFIRGSGQPRVLGSIMELASLFAMDDVSGVSPNAASPATGSSATSLPVRGKVDTLRPPPTAAAAPPPPEPRVESPSFAPDSVGSARHVESLPNGQGDPARGRENWGPSTMPPPTRPIRRARSFSEAELQEARSLVPLSDDPSPPVPRRRFGRWIVALALSLSVGVVSWAALKPYLSAREAGASQQRDPRFLAFVSNGERAMAEGDLDLSQEDLDKASALAEGDGRLLLDQARVAAAKADIPWLKLRLLDDDAVEDVRTTRSQLDELGARAQRAAKAARSANPDAPGTLLAEVDALRLVGDRAAARSLVAKLAQHPEADAAYVLAALDLTEPDPVWATAIGRLRVAASAEGHAGRARAALVYALARSGDREGARAELASLDALARPYPVLPNLHTFLQRMTAQRTVAERTAAASDPGAAATNAVPIGTRTPTTPPRRLAAGAAGEASTGDPRGAMQAASAAIRRGDFSRARQLYEGIIARSPNDSEALAGLGDVARLNGDASGAIDAYRRAIAVNPSYLPALIGLADTQWASGDRVAATTAYSDIVERFPEGTYPSYVAQRGTAAASPPKAPSPGNPADLPRAAEQSE